MCAYVCLHSASAPATWRSARASKRSIVRGIPEASSCGMGALALALPLPLPLPATTSRQHIGKGSHKKNDKNDVNAVASKCINLEVFCVSVNGRPAKDQ